MNEKDCEITQFKTRIDILEKELEQLKYFDESCKVMMGQAFAYFYGYFTSEKGSILSQGLGNSS